MLTNILSARHRKRAYATYALLGLVIGAIQVGYVAAEAGQPTWLTVTLAVFGFLGTGLGLTAAGNTHTNAADVGRAVQRGLHRGDTGAGETRMILIIAGALLLAWIVVSLLTGAFAIHT